MHETTKSMIIPVVYKLQSQQNAQAMLQPFTASYLDSILMPLTNNGPLLYQP